MTPSRENWILPALLVLGALLVIGGGVQFALTLITPRPAHATSDPVTQFIFARSLDLPMLLTEGGTLFYPNENNEWEPLFIDEDVTVQGVFTEKETGNLVLATSLGMARYDNGSLAFDPDITMDDLVRLSNEMVMTDSHGDVYNLYGENVPLPEKPDKMLMLEGGSVLQAGERLYISVGMDEWEPLGPSVTITDMWMDEDGSLLADTPDGVLRWGQEDDVWEPAYPHNTDDAPFEDFQVFNGTAFATVNGGLLRYADDVWHDVELDAAVYLSQLEVGQDNRLWLLDTGGNRLWSTTDGTTWSEMVITIAASNIPGVE